MTTNVRWRYTTGPAPHGRGVYVDAVRVIGPHGIIFDDRRPHDAALFSRRVERQPDLTRTVAPPESGAFHPSEKMKCPRSSGWYGSAVGSRRCRSSCR